MKWKQLADEISVFDSFKRLLSFSYRPVFTRQVGHFVAVKLKRLCDIIFSFAFLLDER